MFRNFGINMKKSEMVKIIEEFYRDHNEKIGHGWAVKDFAENLLTDLELEGMLPPSVLLPNFKVYDNVWEDENE